MSLLTPRQQREREFFDEYWSSCEELPVINFDPISGRERRPWNPYWHVIESVKKQYEGGARTLLDFGCGGGTYAAIFASLGFRVSAFDISPRCIETARKVAAVHGLSEDIEFSVQRTEDLHYADDTFDVVVGIDVLHHVEIAPSVAESIRVLKPGGTAFFREWIEVPGLDYLRNTAPVRFFFPTKKNLDPLAQITEDERKLTDRDLAVIRGLCSATTERRFYVFARLDRLLRNPQNRAASFMEKADYFFCRKIPSLNKLGGSVVLELSKSPQLATGNKAHPPKLHAA